MNAVSGELTCPESPTGKHYWKYGSPVDGFSHGECIHCGTERADREQHELAARVNNQASVIDRQAKAEEKRLATEYIVKKPKECEPMTTATELLNQDKEAKAVEQAAAENKETATGFICSKCGAPYKWGNGSKLNAVQSCRCKGSKGVPEGTEIKKRKLKRQKTHSLKGKKALYDSRKDDIIKAWHDSGHMASVAARLLKEHKTPLDIPATSLISKLVQWKLYKHGVGPIEPAPSIIDDTVPVTKTLADVSLNYTPEDGLVQRSEIDLLVDQLDYLLKEKRGELADLEKKRHAADLTRQILRRQPGIRR